LGKLLRDHFDEHEEALEQFEKVLKFEKWGYWKSEHQKQEIRQQAEDEKKKTERKIEQRKPRKTLE